MLIATKLRFTAGQMNSYSRFLADVPLRAVKWSLAAPVQAGWLDVADDGSHIQKTIVWRALTLRWGKFQVMPDKNFI